MAAQESAEMEGGYDCRSGDAGIGVLWIDG